MQTIKLLTTTVGHDSYKRAQNIYILHTLIPTRVFGLSKYHIYTALIPLKLQQHFARSSPCLLHQMIFIQNVLCSLNFMYSMALKVFNYHTCFQLSCNLLFWDRLWPKAMLSSGRTTIMMFINVQPCQEKFADSLYCIPSCHLNFYH